MTASVAQIESKVFLIRGERAMLDEDLATLYGVETKVLLQAVKRNIERFPVDFMFQLDATEWQTLRSQIVTSNEKPAGRGGRRYAPYAFTEQGVAMLSSVLRSERAIQVNIEIMRTLGSARFDARGELRLAERLKDFLEDNAWVWHNIPVGPFGRRAFLHS